ncbi:FAD-binding oxidoreductase [Oryzobacter telluris]|uniref:FAD-binding oxidoreductase n=1 Tax=Oryzobacter telluris TaxID=3149179 RepID=UPI00370DA4DC
MTTTVTDGVSRLFPDGVLVTDPDIVATYAVDQSRLTSRGQPWAVASPRDTDEVAACLRVAHAHRIPVVTRGAGSGLSGGANAPDGSVVLSTHRMDRVLEIDVADRVAVVQPGVVTGRLRDAVAERGLFYPPDPGSVAFSTIGGNIATNAGGMCCLKYGVTGDFVRALEVVLADGSVMRTGTRTRKGVAGLDLTRLFVGSEGSLAVITEATVRLLPAPGPALTLVATFGSLAAAGRAIAAVQAAGVDLSLLELLDRTTVGAIEASTPLGFDPGVAAVLLAQSDADTSPEQLARAATLLRSTGAVDVMAAEDAQEAGLLLEARRRALPALEALGDWLLDDVCVPPSRIVDLIAGIEEIAARVGLTIGVFGHVGDGNMHPTVIYDAQSASSTAAARTAFDDITGLALSLGGTITGEHGVGRLKTAWLERELDPVALRLQADLKRTVDPRGILNPGSVIAPAHPTST